MQLAIPMQFSKTTKRKTVFTTGDGLAPTSNVYMLTGFLQAAGEEAKQIVATLSNVPFTDDEARRMPATITMLVSRTTKYKTVFAAADTNAPVDSLYVVSEWLRSHEFGDVLYLGISYAASGEGSDDEQDDGDAFERFLDETIIRMPRSRLTTERIWSAWASYCGVSPDREEIGDILRREVAQLFRERFSAPRASRGRVDGRVQYYWESYEINEEGLGVNVHRG